MTIKLNALTRWNILERGQSVVFDRKPGRAPRRVRLHLNLERSTALYIEDKDGPRLLVTAGPGLETVEFMVEGKFAFLAQEGHGEVHWHTAENEPTFAEITDARVFTKIANRRHRNPELEEMMYRAQINADARAAVQMQHMEVAMARRLKELTDGLSAEIVKSNAPGAAVGVSSPAVQPQEPPAAGSPGEAPGSQNGGEQQGGGAGSA